MWEGILWSGGEFIEYKDYALGTDRGSLKQDCWRMNNSGYQTKKAVVTILGIVVANALAALIAAYTLPPANMVIGVWFGVSIYYLTYSLPSRSRLYAELRFLIVALAGMSLGSLSLWIGCGYLYRPVCQRNHLQAQIFSNYFIPIACLLITWLFGRLPKLITARA